MILRLIRNTIRFDTKLRVLTKKSRGGKEDRVSTRRSLLKGKSLVVGPGDAHEWARDKDVDERTSELRHGEI